MPPLAPPSRIQLLAILARPDALQAGYSSTALAQATGASWSTVKRLLAELTRDGLVRVEGRARATRYHLAATDLAATGLPMDADPAASTRYPGPAVLAASPTPQPWPGSPPRPAAIVPSPAPGGPPWSASSLALRAVLSTAATARQPVTYHRGFVDDYRPNESSLLPPALAEELMALGRLPEQLPAGTYARKVLEQLLIDLSWSSSRLEGNRYSLLDTAKLFASGQPAADLDGIMLLNHKAAIEFLVDSVPTLGLGAGLLQNMHALLMHDLLPDTRSLGAIRTKLVNISGTPYVPLQVPQLLREMFELVVAKAQQVRNPVEAAFFLWVNLAYLQPFEDGNKRVSRLAANIPLMLYNQAPLSFLDVDRHDYALAMMGVYEFRDLAMACDLFEWTYRRSQAKYRIVLEAMGAPDPFRIAHRETLGEAVQAVVRERRDMAHAVQASGLRDDDARRFGDMLRDELQALEDYNCARYRLRPGETAEWIAAGRPR